MPSDKKKIEIDSVFVQKIFSLADLIPPEEVTSIDLNRALTKIELKFNSMLASQNNVGAGTSDTTQSKLPENGKKVLVVDDMGIIAYQLDVIFKKMGFDVIVSQEIYDAIEKFRADKFDFAVIDLFIPTEKEGFILLDELKKMSIINRHDTKIIVMTASSKVENKEKCLRKGASFYIEKAQGWQKKIMESCLAAK